MNKAKQLILFLFVLFFLFFHKTFAQRVELVSIQNTYNNKREVRVDIYGKDLNFPINGFSGQVRFPPSLLKLNTTGDEGSRVSVWVEKTSVSKANETGVFAYAGFMPEGLFGQGKILTLNFEVLGEGQIEVWSEKAEVFLSDGSGERVKISDTKIILDPDKDTSLPGKQLDSHRSNQDIEAPEDFEPVMARDASFFEGKWFVSFATLDRQSGISRYEVAEGRFMSEADISISEWKEVTSPYVVVDQDLKNKIYVKAIDNSGNFRTVEVKSSEVSNKYAKYKKLAIILLICLVFVGILFLKKEILSQKNKNAKDITNIQ